MQEEVVEDGDGYTVLKENYTRVFVNILKETSHCRC